LAFDPIKLGYSKIHRKLENHDPIFCGNVHLKANNFIFVPGKKLLGFERSTSFKTMG
jgi:hypothetical protein